MSQQKNHKLGIIIPYRDRANQLFEFKKEIGKHIDFDYEVIVVEQLGDQDFNRGKLLNIGVGDSKMTIYYLDVKKIM